MDFQYIISVASLSIVAFIALAVYNYVNNQATKNADSKKAEVRKHPHPKENGQLKRVKDGRKEGLRQRRNPTDSFGSTDSTWESACDGTAEAAEAQLLLSSLRQRLKAEAAAAAADEEAKRAHVAANEHKEAAQERQQAESVLKRAAKRTGQLSPWDFLRKGGAIGRSMSSTLKRGSNVPSKEQAYTSATLIDPRRDSFAKGPGGVIVELPAGFIDVDEEVDIEIAVLDAIESGSKEFVNVQEGVVPSKEQAYTTTTLIDPRKDSSAKGPGGVLVEFPAGFIDGEEEVVIEIVLLDAIETGSKEFVNLPEGFVPVSPLVSLQVKSSSTGAVLTNTFAKEVRATLPHCIRNANPNGFQVYCMRDGEATFNKLEDPLPFRSDDFSRSAVFATNHFTQFQIICAVGVAALAAAAVVGLAPQLSVHKELELAVMVLMKEGVIKSIAVVLRALDNGVLTIEDKIAQMIVDDGGWQTYRPRNQLEFTPGTKQIELSLETDSLEVCRSATPPFPTSRTRHVEFDVSAFDFDLVLHVRPAGGSDVDAYRFTLQDRGGGGVSGSGGGGGDSGGGSGVSGGGGGGDGCYSSGGGDSGGAAASSIQTEPQLQPQSSPSSLPIAAHIGERRQSINLARDVVAARAICNIDIVKYTAIWEQTLRAEGPDVAALETELDVVEARLQMSGDPQQPTTLNGISDTTSGEYLLQLNLAFEKVEATLFADVEDLVESLDIANLDFHRGPPKKDDRCFEKAQLAYNDDCSKIRDLRRASVVCPNIAAVRNVCAKLDADPKIQLLRVKNRFRRAYNAKDKSAGYRDVQFNIKAVDPETGIELVWELQVHLAAVEVLKMRLQDTADATGRTGHGRYVAFRDIVERL